MKVGLGTDHGGYKLKEEIKQYLEDKGIEYIDYGTNSEERTDYPIYAEKVAKGIQTGQVDCGILLCKSAHGMNIAANKFKGIYAGVCYSVDSTLRGRGDDNINIAIIPALDVNLSLAKEIVDTFLNTEFKEGRYKERLDMVQKFESNEM